MFLLHSLDFGNLCVDLDFFCLFSNLLRYWESCDRMRPAVGFLHMVPGRWFWWHLQEDAAGVAVGFTSWGPAVQIWNSQLANQELGLMSALLTHAAAQGVLKGGLNTNASGMPARVTSAFSTEHVPCFRCCTELVGSPPSLIW